MYGDQRASYRVMGDIIEAIGSPSFGRKLVNGLNELVAFDHATVFTFPREGRVDYLLTEGRLKDGIALNLADSYVKQYFRLDPNRDAIATADEHAARFVRFQPSRITSRRYHELFFLQSRLVDKHSMIFRRQGVAYYCNFYRTMGSGTYREPDVAALETLAPLIVSSIAKHYTALFPHDLAPPPQESGFGAAAPWPVEAGLTDRETAVCDRIVMGFSSEAIALDLGIAESSVKTYRKRAYRKLRISSQNELFALSLRRPPRDVPAVPLQRD